MAQQFMAQHPIDLDDDDEFLPVTQPAQPPQIATAFPMVAQHTLLPVAMTGRRRSRSPSMQIEGRLQPRLRAIPGADPGPVTERGRAWIPAQAVPAMEAPRAPSAFRTRHPSFAMSDSSVPPVAP